LTLLIVRQPKPVDSGAEGGTGSVPAGVRKLPFHH
jgi:hypothetical protein